MSRGKEGAPRPAELPSAAAADGRPRRPERLPEAAPVAVAVEAGAAVVAVAPRGAAVAVVAAGSRPRSV